MFIKNSFGFFDILIKNLILINYCSFLFKTYQVRFGKNETVKKT